LSTCCHSINPTQIIDPQHLKKGFDSPRLHFLQRRILVDSRIRRSCN
jgi:hypothetical protein